MEQLIFDFYDEPDFMAGVVDYYREQSFAYLKAAGKLNPQPDFVMIHGSTCSASVISPHLFETYALPYIQEAATLLKKAGILSLFHVCGRSREWLPLLADTDVNVIDALERPPAGNVDLSEVKQGYGDRLCLKGNVSAITMARGSREQVREEVVHCLDAAAEGGGYVLAVGDSIGPQANLANIEEMVQTGLEYGRY